ncbi:M15 family metallopeptidase [Xylanimonas protaetiae]|uniref:D-alanyl-D-alanine carboxypeptidase-like core domain-containing protein n=1 Tax=Xylanimonas protaetiae TaxID=2509457 RepID=A0A4P6F3J5_9MICO|nr:M15 family metallopeptidase [Xylanimonas protaetiae]QAY70450.1 hypothetical protein ET471_10775 [Xylanimonas protaetiae]
MATLVAEAQTFAGQKYSNGSVPAEVLAELDPVGGHGTDGHAHAYLRRDAAEAWNSARQDVLRRTDISLTVRGWNRTLAEQERFFLRSYVAQTTGGHDARTWHGVRYVRRPGRESVAVPGTSNHGWGLAVDVMDFGRAGQWDLPRRVTAFPVLAEHGWTDTEGRQPHVDEPWHLVYDPAHGGPAPVPDGRGGEEAHTRVEIDLKNGLVVTMHKLRFNGVANDRPETFVRDIHVDNLQGLLNGTQRYHLPVDGVGGPATRDALADWQVFTNTGDGQGHADLVVGKSVWKSLMEY